MTSSLACFSRKLPCSLPENQNICQVPSTGVFSCSPPLLGFAAIWRSVCQFSQCLVVGNSSRPGVTMTMTMTRPLLSSSPHFPQAFLCSVCEGNASGRRQQGRALPVHSKQDEKLPWSLASPIGLVPDQPRPPASLPDGAAFSFTPILDRASSPPVSGLPEWAPHRAPFGTRPSFLFH